MKKYGYTEHHKKFNAYYDRYLDKFGENSLDRVITHDPSYFLYYTEKEIEELIKPLKNAIKTNIPITQMDKDTWSRLVF